ncbi:MAG: autorepressor SdpR family transcription factor [Firmicutes bacterium]|nr:autorepressor SdpR family transcription factor [Bacillota bacterium]
MHEGVFRALADPTRRRILELLQAGPLTAGEIAAHFPSRQPTISRHLSVLKQAGLVWDERQGQFIRYHLNTTVLQSWLQWLWDRWGGHDQP